ncbi:hypothetical protein P691DRAFT_779151 [Macrolepiota fuliginosa MF-IS2]|uniref:Uncharacterized protein n=1 Tax=Macrolepiota fuliginosa MF-IS2 TaxID=1400762 RepID=A0A9P5X4Z4_9AGAR|nr:hypothetical protein P691DRAFT_779151 [Macrolepiota fuliginosa MF-IS2]
MEEIVVCHLARYANDNELSPCLSSLLFKLCMDCSLLDDLKWKEWEWQKALATEENQVDPGVYAMPPFATMEPWAIVSYIIILCLYLMSGVSQDHCSFYLMALTLQHNLPSEATPQNHALSFKTSEIPTTIDTLVSHLKIEPKAKPYMCCQHCFCLYDSDKPIPNVCTFEDDKGEGECREQLRKKKSHMPLHEYVMHDLKDWLARLYTQPGMEELLDHHTHVQPPSDGIMSNIWDAPIVREFCGPDGRPFFGDKGTEGCLIFSINMDGITNPMLT